MGLGGVQEEMGSWTAQMAEDEAQQADMRPQRAPSDAYLGGSSAKRQRVYTQNCPGMISGMLDPGFASQSAGKLKKTQDWTGV